MREIGWRIGLGNFSLIYIGARWLASALVIIRHIPLDMYSLVLMFGLCVLNAEFKWMSFGVFNNTWVLESFQACGW